jgi:hypothetical protein
MAVEELVLSYLISLWKRVLPTKNEPQQQLVSYLKIERKGLGARVAGCWVGQQAGILKVWGR